MGIFNIMSAYVVIITNIYIEADCRGIMQSNLEVSSTMLKVWETSSITFKLWARLPYISAAL